MTRFILHACTGVIIGAEIGRNKFKIEQHKSFFRILVIPIVLHGFYDFFVMFPSFYFERTGVLWVFFMPVFSVAMVIVGSIYARRRAIALLDFNYAAVDSNVLNV